MDEMIIPRLQLVARVLAQIPLDALEQHVREGQESISRADSWGPIIDPTGWLKAQRDGSIEDARYQQAIVKYLLEARRQIEQRERFVQERLEKPA